MEIFHISYSGSGESESESSFWVGELRLLDGGQILFRFLLVRPIASITTAQPSLNGGHKLIYEAEHRKQRMDADGSF